MNYTSITIKEARNNFSELIEKAALTREVFLVTKFGKPKAMIIPADIKEKEEDLKKLILEETAGLWVDRRNVKSSSSYINKLRKRESSRYEKILG